MTRRKSGVKQQRVDKKRHLRNLKIKVALKKTLKKFQATLVEKKIEEAKQLLQKVFSQLDKAAKKKLLNSKTADRRKSRLAKQVAKLSKA